MVYVINKRNKQRSKAMERHIAKYFSGFDADGNVLKGSRVPMSGSGSLKGDCIVPYDEFRNIYVECKLTEKRLLRIQQAWLAKILKEQQEMRCFMAMLVIHFMHTSPYYCLIPEKSIQRLEYDKRKSLARGSTVREVFTAKTIPISYPLFSEWQLPVWIQTLHGKWFVMKHDDCKTMLEN